MTPNYEFFLLSFVSIFVIVNPFGNIPVFLSLTEGLDRTERERISRKSVFWAGSILILFALSGDMILKAFHVTVSDLKIAGGILLMIIAIDMLFGNMPRSKYSEEERIEAYSKEDVAIFPLALPLYTGPGAITTVIVMMGHAHTIIEKSIVMASIILTYLVARVTQKYAVEIFSVLGISGTRVMTRIMAVLLATIAVEFVWSGIEDKISSLMENIVR